MKRLLLPLFALLLSCPFHGWAQSQQISLLDSSYRYGWDTALDDWSLLGRTIYSYDTSNNQTGMLTLVRDSPASPWKNASRTEYNGFDQYGNAIEINIHTWVAAAAAWERFFRHLRIFDSLGKHVETVYYNPDPQTNDWIQLTRIVFTYDGNDNLIEKLFYSWSTISNSWENERRDTYVYDGNGLETENIRYTWLNNEWSPDDKRTSTYDGQGNQIESLSYDWNAGAQQWEAYFKAVNTFDGNGNLTEKIELVLNFSYNTLVNSARVINVFDNSNNQISSTRYFWKFGLNDWVISTELLTAYDADNHSVDAIYSNALGTDSLQFIDRFHFYWSHYDVTAAHDSDGISCSIFPNPAHNQLFVHGLEMAARAAIYSEQGTLIQTTILDSGNAQINIRHLPTGVYLIHLYAGGKMVVRKFVKQ